MEEPSQVSIPSMENVLLSQAATCCPANWIHGDALDVIVVSNNSNSNSMVACSDFVVRFPQQRNRMAVKVELGNGGETPSYKEEGLDMVCRRGDVVFDRGLSTKPHMDALQKLCTRLRPGRNQARYVLYSSTKEQQHDSVLGVAHFSIYLWSLHDRVVVSDIDGTITKSNVRGVLDTVVLERHEYAHPGVCKFLSQLVQEQQPSSQTRHVEENHTIDNEEKGRIHILYLTSRPMSLAQSTRDFLSTLVQHNTHQLPEGPLFCHSGHLGQVLFSEWISKDVHQYKADTLFRQVVLPFAAVNGSRQIRNQVLSVGFGNSTADAMAYEMAGIDRNNIYLIDKQSTISCIDKKHRLSFKKRSKRCDETSSQHAERASDAASFVSTMSLSRSSNESFTHENTTSPQQKMVAVRRRSSYRRLVGTMYQGYDDVQLLSMVRSKLLSP